MKPPKTLDEWKVYAANIAPVELTSKVRAMNSMRFVRMLKDDGMRPGDVSELFKIFAKRLLDAGVAAPGGGYMEMKELVNDPSVKAISLPPSDPNFVEPDWYDLPGRE